ncbi:hypothetical protein ACLBOM_37750 [Escherichia coli]
MDHFVAQARLPGRYRRLADEALSRVIASGREVLTRVLVAGDVAPPRK